MDEIIFRKTANQLECIFIKTIKAIAKLKIAVIVQKMIAYQVFEFCSRKLKKIKFRVISNEIIPRND